MGIELLDDDDVKTLDARAPQGLDEKECYSVMFKLWRERQPHGTWRQLIKALYKLKLNRVAEDVENLIRPAGEQEQHAGEARKRQKQKFNDGEYIAII